MNLLCSGHFSDFTLWRPVIWSWQGRRNQQWEGSSCQRERGGPRPYECKKQDCKETCELNRSKRAAAQRSRDRTLAIAVSEQEDYSDWLYNFHYWLMFLCTIPLLLTYCSWSTVGRVLEVQYWYFIIMYCIVDSFAVKNLRKFRSFMKILKSFNCENFHWLQGHHY